MDCFSSVLVLVLFMFISSAAARHPDDTPPAVSTNSSSGTASNDDDDTMVDAAYIEEDGVVPRKVEPLVGVLEKNAGGDMMFNVYWR